MALIRRYSVQVDGLSGWYDVTDAMPRAEALAALKAFRAKSKRDRRGQTFRLHELASVRRKVANPAKTGKEVYEESMRLIDRLNRTKTNIPSGQPRYVPEMWQSVLDGFGKHAGDDVFVFDPKYDDYLWRKYPELKGKRTASIRLLENGDVIALRGPSGGRGGKVANPSCKCSGRKVANPDDDEFEFASLDGNMSPRTQVELKRLIKERAPSVYRIETHDGRGDAAVLRRRKIEVVGTGQYGRGKYGITKSRLPRLLIAMIRSGREDEYDLASGILSTLRVELV